MRKYGIFIFVLVITSLCVVANDDQFARSLANCANYSSSGNVETSGIKATSTKRILGWQDGKCAYQEKIHMMGIDSVVSCKFSEPQIQELVNVMNAYNTLQAYSATEEATLENIESNPVSKVWSKYLNNPSVCDISNNLMQ